jgi:hypothetical protein
MPAGWNARQTVEGAGMALVQGRLLAWTPMRLHEGLRPGINLDMQGIDEALASPQFSKTLR